ncbi:putative metal-dependent hydrolase [Paenibacillaceae bacterium]|nr:putative metal-dependent hydrolase [Paenibacillaceae bacterium]
MDRIRFPIGPFESALTYSITERCDLIHQIPPISEALQNAVQLLGPERLDTPYREQGWTVRQIIHHMADNDMNAYLRFKRALTEDEPIASSYREDLWADLEDYSEIPVENSLTLLEALHGRFVILLKGLTPGDFARKLTTEALGSVSLDIALHRFVWHNKHHLSQIQSFI